MLLESGLTTHIAAQQTSAQGVLPADETAPAQLTGLGTLTPQEQTFQGGRSRSANDLLWYNGRVDFANSFVNEVSPGHTGNQLRSGPTTTILYPRSEEVLLSSTFFATGIASGEHDRLMGVLSKDGTALTYTGKTLRQPPESTRWVIFFDVPDPDNTTYSLRLYQQDTSGKPLDVAENIQLIPTRGGDTLIVFPGNHEQWCHSTFFAFGVPVEPDTPIRAFMKLGVAGAEIESNAAIVEGFGWYADWIGRRLTSTGENLYRLRVQDNLGNVKFRSSIHLHEKFCEQP